MDEKREHRRVEDLPNRQAMTNACLLISLFDFLSPLCAGKTETWLNNNITDGVVFLPSYSIHRSDRADGVASI